jgi:hypothetical protein
LDSWRVYYKDADGKETGEYIFMGQTKYLDKCTTVDETDQYGYYLVIVPWDSEGMGIQRGLCYNKNKKFFLLAGLDDYFFELVKTFTAME